MPFPLPRPLPMPRPRPPLAPSLRVLREEATLPRASPAWTCIICLHALGLRHVVLGPSALGFGATRAAAAAAAVPARRLLSTAASNKASTRPRNMDRGAVSVPSVKSGNMRPRRRIGASVKSMNVITSKSADFQDGASDNNFELFWPTFYLPLFWHKRRDSPRRLTCLLLRASCAAPTGRVPGLRGAFIIASTPCSCGGPGAPRPSLRMPRDNLTNAQPGGPRASPHQRPAVSRFREDL